jgi:hypothetical protein
MLSLWRVVFQGVLTNYTQNDDKQISIDRINDNIGHVKGNAVISCWACNKAHANKIVGL